MEDVSVPAIINADFCSIDSYPIVIICDSRRRCLHVCLQETVLSLIDAQNSFVHRQYILTWYSWKCTADDKYTCVLEEGYPVTEIIVRVKACIKTILLELESL